jgi:uncharacterized protein (TIGR03083 family)
MESPESLVQLVQSGAKHLEAYLATLPPEAWVRPSACERWEVRDVVGHLVFWAEPYTTWIARAVQGDCSPPEGWPSVGSLGHQPLMELNAQTAIACRERLGEQLFPTFCATNAQFTKVVVGLGPHDWEKPAYHPAMIAPVRNRVEARIMELAVHGWDIRSQLEPVAPLSAETLPVVSDWAGRRGVNFLGLTDFRPHASLLAPVCYHFALTDIPTSGYDIVVENERIRMGPAMPSSPNVTFRGDAETFVLTVLGRLKLDAAIAEGRFTVEGDRGLANELIGWVKRG